jgi:hypothetical protein
MAGQRTGTAVLALARLDDAFSGSWYRQRPAVPRHDGLVEVQVVGRVGMIGALARCGGALDETLVLDRVELRRVGLPRQADNVRGDPLVQGVPTLAGGAVLVEDVHPVTADQVVGVEDRQRVLLQVIVEITMVLQEFEQGFGPLLTGEREPA